MLYCSAQGTWVSCPKISLCPTPMAWDPFWEGSVDEVSMALPVVQLAPMRSNALFAIFAQVPH